MQVYKVHIVKHYSGQWTIVTETSYAEVQPGRIQVYTCPMHLCCMCK